MVSESCGLQYIYEQESRGLWSGPPPARLKANPTERISMRPYTDRKGPVRLVTDPVPLLERTGALRDGKISTDTHRLGEPAKCQCTSTPQSPIAVAARG